MKLTRVQLRRSRGWRKPENTVVVSRPTKWGNPFKATARRSPHAAVQMYLRALVRGKLAITLLDVRVELRGKNLACWCRPGMPCHAEILMKLANADTVISWSNP